MKKLIIPLYVILGIISFYLLFYFVNFCASLRLRSYIKSFEKIEYENQLVPEIEEEGFYTFRTDSDFRIMNLSDIHIGSGIASIKKDLKTIYEVMTQVSVEKPDLCILDGDMIFAVPSIAFHGGGTFDNKMASKNVMMMFDTLGVYYTVTFGNHDSEIFDYYNRMAILREYMKENHPYSIVESNYNYDTLDNKSKDSKHGYGATNQCILLKKTNGEIKKAIMLLDSNAYMDERIISSINMNYDVIHESQVNWAYETLEKLKDKEDKQIKALLFFHIPNEDFEIAYRDLKANSFNDTPDSKYIEGYYNEEPLDDGGRILYGGFKNDSELGKKDILFEKLGPDGLNSMEACFVGHDHVNNAVVEYKGVILSYNLTCDNCAYKGIKYNGKQKGSTIVTIHDDSTFEYVQKFCYDENNGYNLDKDKYFTQDIDSFLFDGQEEPQK